MTVISYKENVGSSVHLLKYEEVGRALARGQGEEGGEDDVRWGYPPCLGVGGESDIYIKLNHFAVHLKLTQRCKSI